jgi:hypothetical protein
MNKELRSQLMAMREFQALDALWPLLDREQQTSLLASLRATMIQSLSSTLPAMSQPIEIAEP